MLELNPETVCFLIARAEVFHSREDVVIPELPDSPADDWARQALADQSGDSMFEEFKSTIDDLEPDQQQALVALMWLGREDYAADEWDVALEEARRNWGNNTAEYLIAHPQVADHLRDGLDKLGYHC
jgi:hypothetical protein